MPTEKTEAVESGEEKVISSAYAISDCSTNDYNFHGNQQQFPVSSGARNSADREYFSCYLTLFSPVWGKKKDLSILCFVNILMDKCRTIQRESAMGDRGLKGSKKIFLPGYLLSRRITGLISACQPGRPPPLCSPISYTSFHLKCNFCYILFHVSSHFFKFFNFSYFISCTLCRRQPKLVFVSAYVGKS